MRREVLGHHALAPERLDLRRIGLDYVHQRTAAARLVDGALNDLLAAGPPELHLDAIFLLERTRQRSGFRRLHGRVEGDGAFLLRSGDQFLLAIGALVSVDGRGVGLLSMGSGARKSSRNRNHQWKLRAKSEARHAMAPVEQRLLLSQASGGRQCDAAAGKWASKLAHYPAAHAGTVDMDALSLAVRTERWPIAGSFAISRGAKTEATVVVAELTSGPHRVRGECVPYARYGETVEGVVAAVETMRPLIEQGLDRHALQGTMPPCAARNALDCAFWDLAAKRAGKPAHELAGLAPPKPLVTAYTISLDTPKAMAAAAAGAADRKLLKVKLGGEGDRARIEAVRRAAPASELIVDAN